MHQAMKLLNKLDSLTNKKKKLDSDIDIVLKELGKLVPPGTELGGVINMGGPVSNVLWMKAFHLLASKIPGKHRDSYVSETLKEVTIKGRRDYFRRLR